LHAASRIPDSTVHVNLTYTTNKWCLAYWGSTLQSHAKIT